MADQRHEPGRAEQRPGRPFDEILAVMHRRHGLAARCYDTARVEGSSRRRIEARASGSAARYAGVVAEDRAEAVELMGSFQNHHSEFFRDPLVFAFLEERILPNLLFRRRSPAGREIRVWSAGCAAGQEAYSVALLCRELSQRMEDAPPFRIFATDLSETQIALARAGSYSAPDVRNVTQQRLWRWFDRQGEAWVVRPELRALVDFSAHDLLDLRVTSPAASIFGDFDLVLCCNQLMYFRPECTRRVLQKLKRSLAPGGWLVTGDAERVLVQGEGFEPAPLPAAVFTRGDDP